MTTTHRPISDDELHGAVVMECSLGQFDQQIDALRTEVQILRNLNLSLIDALKAFGDLYLELTDETKQRKFLSRSILRAERQAARLRLPTWFWRAEPEKSLKESKRLPNYTFESKPRHVRISREPPGLSHAGKQE